MKRLLIMTMALLTLAAEVHAMEAPWSVNENSPVIDDPLSEQQSRDEIFSETNAFIVLIKGFQRYVSPVDGDRCNMYPTCSTYGLHAFRKHGAFKGIVLTADRLLHEYDEAAFAPLIMKSGKARYYDPVEYNDFWWHE